jgi:exonuclease VII large subunit
MWIKGNITEQTKDVEVKGEIKNIIEWSNCPNYIEFELKVKDLNKVIKCTAFNENVKKVFNCFETNQEIKINADLMNKHDLKVKTIKII